MAKPLRLFIRPPYNTWSLVHGYGWMPQPNDYMHQHITLRTNGNGELFAAATGKLSIYPPEGYWPEPLEKISVAAPGDPLPASVKLYLHMTPFRALNSLFRTRAAEVVPGISSDFTGLRIEGFRYIGVETGSLEGALADALDVAIFPGGGFTRAEVVQKLVTGELSVPITAGHALGRASSHGAPAGFRQVGFNFLSHYGAVDPSHMYDWMRDFVDDSQSDLDDFLALVPKTWPILNVSNVNLALDYTKNALYPMVILQEVRGRLNFTAAQWREVGDNQKNLWRARLLKRAGHAPVGSPHPPFEFNGADLRNIFQLEALVEFYINFNDPWHSTPPSVEGANVPRSPFLADGVTSNPNYLNIDFLTAPPAGVSASVVVGSFQSISLDGTDDLAHIQPNFDTVFLTSDTARPTRLYKILAVDAANRALTLDGFPNLTGGFSQWMINGRPHLVLVDSFGTRDFTDNAGVRHNLRGSNAKASAVSVLTLDGPPNLRKVNPFFDMIYLSSDTARNSRTYRIVAVDNANHRVILDANPTLDGGTSAWHIPAGVSGELPAAVYTLGPGGANGFDHYDGLLFLVEGGEIRSTFRWSSYSSRDNVGENLSSIRGNQRYRFASRRAATNNFINYAFHITNWTPPAEPVEARFYFPMQLTAQADANGKTAIMIHDGSSTQPAGGTGSAGCIVNPSIYTLRDQLIDIYQIEYSNHYGNRDPEVDKARGRDRRRSQLLWTNTRRGVGRRADRLTGGDWDDKILGTFWIIRPDEKPLA